MCTVYATANVSGGHLNPAVTFTTCLTGHMSWPRGGLYCVAQLLGAIFGALIAVRRLTWPDIRVYMRVKITSPVCVLYL